MQGLRAGIRSSTTRSSTTKDGAGSRPSQPGRQDGRPACAAAAAGGRDRHVRPGEPSRPPTRVVGLAQAASTHSAQASRSECRAASRTAPPNTAWRLVSRLAACLHRRDLPAAAPPDGCGARRASNPSSLALRSGPHTCDDCRACATRRRAPRRFENAGPAPRAQGRPNPFLAACATWLGLLLSQGRMHAWGGGLPPRTQLPPGCAIGTGTTRAGAQACAGDCRRPARRSNRRRKAARGRSVPAACTCAGADSGSLAARRRPRRLQWALWDLNPNQQVTPMDQRSSESSLVRRELPFVFS